MSKTLPSNSMSMLTNISPSQFNFLLTFVAVGSIVVGFFTGHVTGEVFYGTMGGIIAHFYQGTKISDLKDQVEQQSVTIQTLNPNADKTNVQGV